MWFSISNASRRGLQGVAERNEAFYDLGRASASATTRETAMNKVTPFLMFNDQLEAAIAFYTATFRDSEVRSVARTG